jgi:hypothetical protein
MFMRVYCQPGSYSRRPQGHTGQLVHDSRAYKASLCGRISWHHVWIAIQRPWCVFDGKFAPSSSAVTAALLASSPLHATALPLSRLCAGVAAAARKHGESIRLRIA